jgi:hypothetical protein
MKKLFAILVLVCGCAAWAQAQNNPQAPAMPPTAYADSIKPNPADVQSTDAIVAALYNVISGPAGQARDWNRFRSLFAREARLVAHQKMPDGKFVTVPMTPDGYIKRATARFQTNGFFEKEIARRTERFGNIVHVFTTYEARENATDEKPMIRGINSIQLLNDGTRWYVLTVFWQAESPDTQLPDKYLQTVKE